MLSQLNIESKIEEVAIETALKVIHDSDALVKTICSPVNDNQSWDEIIPKLIKTQTEAKHGSPQREITATTLLPADGKMNLFKPSNPKYQVMVGLLFDLKKCAVQYVFPNNVFSKEWLNIEGKLIPPQITLDQLRAINSQARRKGIVLDNNEVLAGLSMNSLVGVFATENDLFSRLNALDKRHLIKRTLNKIVPVLIITPQDGIIIYDEQQQMNDIQKALSRDKNDPVRILVDHEQLEIEDVPEKKRDTLNARYLGKNFLTNDNIPNDIKAIALSYLDFSELAKLAHETTEDNEDRIIQNLIRKEFDRKKESDLNKLISELSQPINTETVYKLITTETHDFPIIERAIIHLCYLQPRAAEQVLSDYFFHVSASNQNIISAFLRHCPVLGTKKREKTVVFIEGGNNTWEYDPDVVVNLKQWSPLVGAVLSNNPLVVNLIVELYPKHIPDMMAALNELAKISAQYSSCDYSLDQIAVAKKTLLLQLKQKHNEHYTLTYADKRLIEEHLFSEISNLNSKKSLYAFYQQHADGLCLFQHRHAHYDSIRQKPFPEIKEKILAALQNKAMQMSNDIDVQLTGKEKELLDNEISKLKSILQVKREALLKQDRKATLSFYSTSRTDEKIKAIGKSLEKLDAITHFSELRLFTEGLLLNNELTFRRGVGLMASDTYLKLKIFYENCFIVSGSSNKSLLR